MPICRHFWPCFILALLPVITSKAYANNVLEVDDVEKFKFECIQNPQYNMEFKFAPVKRLAEEQKPDGQWSYEFTTADKQYAEKQIQLPESGAVRVDLVMQLNKSDSEIGEGYLWNVIVAPSVNGWGFGGYWPTKKPVTQYPRLLDKRESLVSMATLSTYDGQPVHTKIPPKDIDSAGTLNNAWEDIFGKKIVSNLLYPGSKGAQSGQVGYTLTFYYVPTPALRLINEGGYKWPSFKHVDKEGKVFGFVLTSDGECLAWDSIDVVK